MIVEMRMYTCFVGLAGQFVAVYRDKGLPIQVPIHGEPLGFYQTEFGPMNQVVLLWGFDSEEDRRERRARLVSAPGWMDFLKQAAPLVQSEESRMLVPA